MPASSSVVSAARNLMLGVVAGVNEMHLEERGLTQTLARREYLLMLALRSIAEGDVKIRRVREFAAESLRTWDEAVGL